MQAAYDTGARPASSSSSSAGYKFAGAVSGTTFPPRRVPARLTSSASSSHEPSPTTPRYGNIAAAGVRVTSLGSASVLDESSASLQSYADRPAPDIVDRPRDRTRQHEVSHSALSFLFAEMVSYTQNRVSGISDLERKLSLIGYTIGQRVLHLTLHRQEMSTNPKNPKRETRLLPTLLWIHGAFWKAAFGKQADSLERSTESGRGDEYMISTNVPTFSKAISIPKDMSQLSVEAITAGMVEAALDGLGFPARVTAHTVPTPEYPTRTTILIKLDRAVMDREEALGP